MQASIGPVESCLAPMVERALHFKEGAPLQAGGTCEQLVVHCRATLKEKDGVEYKGLVGKSIRLASGRYDSKDMRTVDRLPNPTTPVKNGVAQKFGTELLKALPEQLDD